MPKYLAVHMTVADANAEMLLRWLKVAVKNAGGVLVASPGWTQDRATIVDAMRRTMAVRDAPDYDDVRVIDLNDHI